MKLPDPKDFQDGIAFMREMHKVVLHNCALLEQMIVTAESEGVFPSFASHDEWNELFTFFTKISPRHEQDEEEFLFPMLSSKLPKIGFQPPDAPIRFLVDGHAALHQQAQKLIEVWNSYRQHAHDMASLKASASAHPKEDAEFIAVAKELAALYRQHVATEEVKVYREADKLLSDRDKRELLYDLRGVYDNESDTGVSRFEPPQFTDPGYSVRFVRGPQGRDAMDAEFEEQ